MKKGRIASILFYCILSFSVFAQQTRGIVSTPELQILKEDITVIPRLNENGEKLGIDLYIRKKEHINSVMLCETTKDPEGKEPNYAYRAKEWNETNGDEIRYLNGAELNSKYGKFSLISSTPVPDKKFGTAFHIFIPPVLEYGYPWSRNGTIEIGKGTFINIRTFEQPYGDYSGRSMDNPFMFNFELPKKKSKIKRQHIKGPEKKPKEVEKEEIVLTDDYNPIAAQHFAEIAKEGQGLIVYSKGPETLTKDLLQVVGNVNHTKADIVFCIDTTGSMKDDMDTLRKEWIPILVEQAKQYDDLRLGLLFYRDYNDNYSYKGLPVKVFDFTRDTNLFTKNLNSTVIHGNEGGDVPEAVYEALYAGMALYEWRQDAERKIILIGDAEPHPRPRGSGKFSREFVMNLSKEKGITLDCIIVPDEKRKS